MKKNYKSILSLGFAVVFSTVAFSQAINESFDDITTLTAAGWAQQNLGTPVGTNPNWVQGNATVFPANSGATNAFIAANYQSVTGANTISNWLFTPERTFTNGDVISFFTRTAGSFADNLQVRLSTNGASVNAGATNTSVGDFTTLLLEINPTLVVANYPTVWTQYSITISGLGAPTNGRIAFRYFVTDGGPSGNNSNYIGVDDFVYTPAGSPTEPDAAVSLPKAGPYSVVPLSQVSALPLSATISNPGTAPVTDAILTVNVYQLPSTLVQTTTSSATAVGVGSSVVATAGTFTPTAVGDYYLEYIVTATGNVNTANDTTELIFQVDDSTYARDVANVTGVIGIGGLGTGQGGQCGNMFNVLVQDTLTSIHAFISNQNGALNGTNLVANLYSWNGTAASLIASTVPVALDSAVNKNTLHELDLVGGQQILAPGMYLVTVQEGATNASIGTTPGVYTAGGILVDATGITTGFVEQATVYASPFVWVVRAVFGTTDTQTSVQELTTNNWSVYPNPAVNTVAVRNAEIGSTIEIFNNLGQLVHSEIVNSNNVTINIAEYNTGIYTLKNTSNETVSSQSIVKQ